MKCNSSMLQALHDAHWYDLELPTELSVWVGKGFINKNGCVFLAALFNGYPSDKNLIDKTGVECFINSFHIDDYVSERYLDYSCLFCNTILSKWALEECCEKLNMIVSMDEFGAVIKFHVLRDGEEWLGNNLERYEEAVFTTNDIIEN